MTSTVLKYNTYHEIISRRGGKFRVRGRGNAVHMPDDALMALLMRVSIVLIVAFMGVYIAEKSSMVFSQRAAFTQEQKAAVAAKEVSNLEITTTQLAAAHNLNEVASVGHMVIPAEVSYLNIEGDAVAFAK